MKFGSDKQAIDKPGFCILPWIHTYSKPNGELLTCCNGLDTSLGNKKMSIVDQLNSDLYKEVRRSMLAGEWHANCMSCKSLEDFGSKSSRTTANRLMGKYLNPSQEVNTDGSLIRPRPLYMDLRFSNLCNFRCRTCHSSFSSSWKTLENKLEGKKDTCNIDISNYSLSEILENLSFVKRIVLAGGEPLIDKSTKTLLKELIRLNRCDISLNIITNFSAFEPGNEGVLDLLSEFDNLHLTISLDGTGKRGEYIRHGLKWNKTVKNLSYLMKYTPKAKFNIHFTYCLLNSYHLIDFHKWVCNLPGFCLEQFTLNILVGPEYLRADILPQFLRNKLVEEYEAYNRSVIPSRLSNSSRCSLSPAINMLKNSKYDEQSSRRLLRKFFTITEKLDFYNKKSLADTLPELSLVKDWTFN